MADVAVVTGAASGIGEASARVLRERGLSVIGVDLAAREPAENIDLGSSGCG